MNDDLYNRAEVKLTPKKIKKEIPEELKEKKALKDIVIKIWDLIDDVKTIKEISKQSKYEEKVVQRVLEFLQKCAILKIDSNEKDQDRLFANDVISLWSKVRKVLPEELPTECKMDIDRVTSIIDYLEREKLIEIKKKEDGLLQKKPIKYVLKQRDELKKDIPDEDLDIGLKHISQELQESKKIEDEKSKPKAISLFQLTEILNETEEKTEKKSEKSPKNDVEKKEVPVDKSVLAEKLEKMKNYDEFKLFPKSPETVDKDVEQKKESTDTKDSKGAQIKESDVKSEDTKKDLSLQDKNKVLEQSKIQKTEEKEVTLKKDIELEKITKEAVLKKMQELQNAKTKREKDSAEHHIIETIHKQLETAIDSGADHKGVKNVVTTIKDVLFDFSRSISSEQSKVTDQMTTALLAILHKLEENSRRLESIANIGDKKVGIFTKKVYDNELKRQEHEKKEIEKYLQYLKKKKTSEGDDLVAFD